METEKIEWDKLETKRTVVTYQEPIYEEKQLPEGVYTCPMCYGSGRITEIYRDPGPNKMGKCWMCHGTGEITKCPNCKIKPVPNKQKIQECVDCFEHTSKLKREDFMRRVREEHGVDL